MRRDSHPAEADARPGRAEHTDADQAAIAGIQRGLQGMYDGTGEDAEAVFAALERELGIAERA